MEWYATRARPDAFEANRDEPVIGRLALEAFGGLRASSAGRIPARASRLRGEGDHDARETPQEHKAEIPPGPPGRSLGLAEGAPAACWTDITRDTYKHHKRFAWARARIPEYHNGLDIPLPATTWRSTKTWRRRGT